MALPNLVFSVASEYDGKGLGKARKDVAGFDKTVKNLAKTIGVTLSAAAVVNFGKQSVKAFLADDKAAATLTKTLNNLGLAFEDQRIRTYVSNLESASGVLDSELRPALQGLLATTGSVAKSQELLGLALDVAAGSGESLVNVSNDIAQAYVGNTKGLKKYNLGLTQTELKTASFVELQTRLNKQFAGQNAARLDTYAGKLSLIKVSYDNMQETIGKGLVDSFVLLAGDNGIGGATSAIETFGQTASDVILGVATLVDKITPKSGIQGEPGFWHDLYIAFGGQIIEDLSKIGQATRIAPKPFKTPMSISGQSTANNLSQIEIARVRAEEAAKKRAAELLAIQKKDLLAKKANLALSKAAAIFDIQKIQLAAALKGKISEEERIRLLALQAIENENGELAIKYASDLFKLQGYNASQIDALFKNTALSLQDFLTKLQELIDKKVPNPFDELIKGAQDYYFWWGKIGDALKNAAIQALILKQNQALNTNNQPAADTSTASYAPGGYGPGGTLSFSGLKLATGGVVTDPTIAMIGEAGPEAVIPLNRMGSFGGVTYNIYATGIGDAQIAKVVQNALQELNRYGSSTTYAGAL